jgi:hypothetical protein
MPSPDPPPTRTHEQANRERVGEARREGFPIMSEAQFELLMRYINARANLSAGIGPGAPMHRDAACAELREQLCKSLVYGQR